MQRPSSISVSTENCVEYDPLEDHPLFTPDLEYFTPLSTVSLDSTHAYCPRTFTFYDIERYTILPSFPQHQASATIDSTNSNDIRTSLLLCNVPDEQLSQSQLAQRQPNVYLSTFLSLTHNHPVTEQMTNDSFMISIYKELLADLSIKWNISTIILDYNLAKLRQCTKMCLEQLQQRERQEHLQLFNHLPSSATFSIEELPLALEFYLQIDVDLFYLKTSWFRHAIPIEGNIFCSKVPIVQYGITACNQADCTCCHPLHPRIHPGQTETVQFNTKTVHRFVNGYQAILNCPATCETNNIIYVLTCPCGEYDYIGATTMSLRDCLTMHRYESNRILAEFILGPAIVKHFSQGIKTEETRKNNAMWLYQHTARCPKAIQLFLDANSDYWCLVPMTLADPTLQLNEASLPPPPPDEKDSNELPSVRIKAYVKYLTDLIPTPPEKYTFSDCQKYQQRYFFQKGKDQLLFTSPQTNADLYNANIVAVLPDNCSEMLRQLILSLFITHADCKLNKTGRLINGPIHRPYPVRDHWCANLARRPRYY